MLEILETNDKNLEYEQVWIVPECFADRREKEIGKEKAQALRDGKVVFIRQVGLWIVLSKKLPTIC